MSALFLDRASVARFICRAFNVPMRLIAPEYLERPAVRARRLHIERAMRARARRARRHGRVLR